MVKSLVQTHQNRVVLWPRQRVSPGLAFSFVGRQLHQELEPVSCPILVISCFNGIGGSFHIYDVLGVRVMGKVTSDNCGEANRVTRTTWPEVEEYHDNVGS